MLKKAAKAFTKALKKSTYLEKANGHFVIGFLKYLSGVGIAKKY